MGKGLDIIYIFSTIQKLVPTIPFTLFVIIVSGALGLALGVLLTAVRVLPRRTLVQKALYAFVMSYVSLERSTPGLIQLFLVFYGLPIFLATYLGLDVNNWSRTSFGIIALVLHNGAYVSEVLRPAYFAVDKGQHDAADSICMSGFQKVKRIILPQMLPIALPSLGNLLVTLIKDTSLLFTIGVVDLMGKAKIINTNDFGVAQFEVYVAVSIVYWALTTAANKCVSALEKRYRYAGLV
jgi:L-cystine transport system permease protein